MSIGKNPVSEAEDVPFAEQTALTTLMGDDPKTRILVVLLSEGNDVNVSHIAEQAGISKNTVYNHLEPLLLFGVIEKTREVGSTSMYQINKSSDIAKNLAQLDRSATRYIAQIQEE